MAEASSTMELGLDKNNVELGQLKRRQCGDSGRLYEGNDLKELRVSASGS